MVDLPNEAQALIRNLTTRCMHLEQALQNLSATASVLTSKAVDLEQTLLIPGGVQNLPRGIDE